MGSHHSCSTLCRAIDQDSYLLCTFKASCAPCSLASSATGGEMGWLAQASRNSSATSAGTTAAGHVVLLQVFFVLFTLSSRVGQRRRQKFSAFALLASLHA